MEFSTADLCDAHSTLLDDGRLAVLAPVFRMFGKRTSFAGPAVTLKVFEDNALLRSTLAGPGQGRVLVVDGGGSLRRALVGSELALLGQDNGWAGIVLNGCVRDCAEINACDIGIRALAAHPRRCARTGAGEQGVRLFISCVPVNPGDWIYADADGILVAQQKLA
jgi:regulator of ribonuclease activity A